MRRLLTSESRRPIPPYRAAPHPRSLVENRAETGAASCLGTAEGPSWTTSTIAHPTEASRKKRAEYRRCGGRSDRPPSLITARVRRSWSYPCRGSKRLLGAYAFHCLSFGMRAYERAPSAKMWAQLQKQTWGLSTKTSSRQQSASRRNQSQTRNEQTLRQWALGRGYGLILARSSADGQPPSRRSRRPRTEVKMLLVRLPGLIRRSHSASTPQSGNLKAANFFSNPAKTGPNAPVRTRACCRCNRGPWLSSSPSRAHACPVTIW